MSMNRRKFLKLTGVGLGGALAMPQTVGASGAKRHTGRHISMLYDTTKCIGCNACSNGCRDWNHTGPEPGPNGLYDAPQDLSADTWTIIKVYQGEEGEYSFVKHQCMHCVDPACTSACPVQALEKNDNGAVVYDAARCIGCRYCMVACPFHIPQFEWDEPFPRIAKCTLCFDRLAVGDGPRCAEYCPTGALIWGRWDEMLAEAEQRLADNPDRYVNHIYGKDEAGGLSVFYLSHVPFEKLGLPKLDPKPHPELSNNVATFGTPTALLAVAGVLTGVHWVTKRRAEE
jgi:formate dehydrogenase iron-sulfur subunit